MVDLGDWLPRYDVRTRHEIDVAAPQDTAYRSMRELDLGRSALVRGLMMARGMHTVRTIDAFIDAGFVLLVDRPPDGLVLGAIGRFWRPRGSLRRFDPNDFTTFDEPGLAKAAWSFEVHEEAGGSRIGTETRVLCTDAVGRRRFRRYWRVVGPFSSLIRRRMLRIAKRSAEAGEPG